MRIFKLLFVSPTYTNFVFTVYCVTNRQRKPTEQSRMDNPQTQATLVAQGIGQTKQKQKQTNNKAPPHKNRKK